MSTVAEGEGVRSEGKGKCSPNDRSKVKSSQKGAAAAMKSTGQANQNSGRKDQAERPTLMVDGSKAKGQETLQERINAFKSDPQLMEVATKFVNEVIEKAKEEAMRRLKEKNATEPMETDGSCSSRKRGPWHSRARGFLTRIFASLCFCNSNVKAS